MTIHDPHFLAPFRRPDRRVAVCCIENCPDGTFGGDVLCEPHRDLEVEGRLEAEQQLRVFERRRALAREVGR